MRSASHVLLTLALGGPLAAQDFAPLAQASRSVYPGKQHFGVVCDYNWSHAAVASLAAALGPEARITVLDLRTPEDLGRAQGALSRIGSDILVLLPKDRFVRDGSFYATVLAHRAANRMPTIGTMRAALSNGAAFAIGEDTSFELLVNNQLKGIIGPVQPGGAVSKAASTRLARIDVVGLGR